MTDTKIIEFSINLQIQNKWKSMEIKVPMVYFATDTSFYGGMHVKTLFPCNLRWP